MRSSSWPMPAWPTRSGDGGWCGLSSRAGKTFVASAVHQRGDHMVEHDPVWDPAAVAAPRVSWGELGALADPISAANSTHSGSIRDAGSDSSGDHQDSAIP
jgi:hypothetical protein